MGSTLLDLSRRITETQLLFAVLSVVAIVYGMLILAQLQLIDEMSTDRVVGV